MAIQQGCLTVVGIASLALSTGAEAACLYNSSTVNGQPSCSVNMRVYADYCSGISGISSTGSYSICQESWQAAVNDASTYLGTTANSTYIIIVSPGSYDYSSETTPITGLKGAIDVSGIAPTSSGCLVNNGTDFSSGPTLSGSGCLVIQGGASSTTTLVTAANQIELYGKDASHIFTRWLTFIEPDETSTQGTYVSSGTTSIQGTTYATLSLDIPSGYPTPLDLFTFNCQYNSDQSNPSNNGCTSTATSPYAKESIQVRAFTTSLPREPIQSTSATPYSGGDYAQIQYGYPETDTHTQLEYLAPTQGTGSNTSTWTITMSWPQNPTSSPQVIPNSMLTTGNLVCLKVDGGGTFYFINPDSTSTDIAFDNVVWQGATRGVFRGVSGSTSGFPYGGQIYNSTLEPNTISGAQACVSQGGGPQFGQNIDPPIWGNVVYNLTATSTGDDTVAMFNDIGSGATQSYIEQSTFTGSFARSVLLSEDPTRISSTNTACPGVGSATGTAAILPCTSPVQVDTSTQDNVFGCDSLFTKHSAVTPSEPNCPIYYAP